MIVSDAHDTTNPRVGQDFCLYITVKMNKLNMQAFMPFVVDAIPLYPTHSEKLNAHDKALIIH